MSRRTGDLCPASLLFKTADLVSAAACKAWFAPLSSGCQSRKPHGGDGFSFRATLHCGAEWKAGPQLQCLPFSMSLSSLLRCPPSLAQRLRRPRRPLRYRFPGEVRKAVALPPAESPVPSTTTSVNTLNPTVSVQGAYSGSARSTAQLPFSGKLSLAEAIERGIRYNLGAVGMAQAVLQAQRSGASRPQRLVAQHQRRCGRYRGDIQPPIHRLHLQLPRRHDSCHRWTLQRPGCPGTAFANHRRFHRAEQLSFGAGSGARRRAFRRGCPGLRWLSPSPAPISR